MKRLRVLSMMAATGLMALSLASCGGSNLPGSDILVPSGTEVDPAVDQRRIVYDLAVNSGYTGSYEEWLESIRGDEIELRAVDNKLQWKFKSKAEWIDLYDFKDLTLPSGMSAYEIYKKYNPDYTGTEEQWINDLIEGKLSNKESYKVTLVYNLIGMEPKTVVVKKSESMDLPQLNVEGYTFKGWVNMYGELVAGTKYTPTSDMVLSARFERAGGGGEAPTPTPTPSEPIDPNTITIKLSGTGSDEQLNMELVEKWKAKRKAAGDTNTYNIEYLKHGPDVVAYDFDDFKSAEAPDVFEYASDKMGVLQRKGALTKLENNYEAFINSNLNYVGRNAAYFNDGYYGFTFTGDNTYYFQYDKRVFTDEDVKSIEGILDKAQSLNKKVGYNLSTAFYSAGLLFTFGADFKLDYNSSNAITNVNADFDGIKGQKAIKGMKSIMAHSGWTDTVEAPSAKNGIAGCIAGTWEINSYKDALGENYGCAPLPTITVDGDTKNIGCFLGGRLMGVNPKNKSNTKKMEAATNLAMFLADEEAQTIRYQETIMGPCHNKVLASEELKADPNIQVLAKQAEWAHAQGEVPAGIWSAPYTLFEQIKANLNVDVSTLAKALNDGIKKVS